jgi:hypothetical protein
MSYRFICALTTCAVMTPLPVTATDLSKIDRTIGKEPAYESKPKYCLVVYGPEATTRIWLVLDDNVLYTDRNGDGDLTDKHERILKTNSFEVSVPERQGVGSFSLRVAVTPGRDGEDTFGQIWCRPTKRNALTESPSQPPWYQKIDGVLAFADRPQDAPIVHFAGRLTLTVLDWHKPRQPRQFVRGKENEFSILLGTPVFGGKHEAFATVDEGYARVAGPGNFPVAEVEFSGKDLGAKPAVTRAKMRY